jgi:hypothetical protein
MTSLIFIFDPVIPIGMTAKNKNRRKPASPRISKRLIAAAPNLLWACESILCTCEDMELDDIGAIREVRSAISLATGKIVRRDGRH